MTQKVSIERSVPGFKQGQVADVDNLFMRTYSGSGKTDSLNNGASATEPAVHSKVYLNVLPTVTVPEDVDYSISEITPEGFNITLTNNTGEAAKIAYSWARTSLGMIPGK